MACLACLAVEWSRQMDGLARAQACGLHAAAVACAVAEGLWRPRPIHGSDVQGSGQRLGHWWSSGQI